MKTLSTRIAEEETVLRGVSNRAAFLVVRDEVKQAIDDGWSLRAIWRTLHKKGKMPCGYEAFRTYVKRLVPREQKTPATTSTKSEMGNTEKVSGERFPNQPPGFPQNVRHEWILHTVVATGEALPDAIDAFARLLLQFPKGTTFDVWLNPHWDSSEQPFES